MIMTRLLSPTRNFFYNSSCFHGPVVNEFDQLINLPFVFIALLYDYLIRSVLGWLIFVFIIQLSRKLKIGLPVLGHKYNEKFACPKISRKTAF